MKKAIILILLVFGFSSFAFAYEFIARVKLKLSEQKFVDLKLRIDLTGAYMAIVHELQGPLDANSDGPVVCESVFEGFLPPSGDLNFNNLGSAFTFDCHSKEVCMNFWFDYDVGRLSVKNHSIWLEPILPGYVVPIGPPMPSCDSKLGRSFRF